MAITCPVDLDTIRLRQEIREIYARVAAEPSSEFHFHRGPAYAADRLGYDSAALAALPSEATASFAGVANPLRMNAYRCAPSDAITIRIAQCGHVGHFENTERSSVIASFEGWSGKSGGSRSSMPGRIQTKRPSTPVLG